MVNNFYVGEIYHKKRFIKFKYDYLEKRVLYTEDNFNYLDLLSNKEYTTDTKDKDYIVKDSLVPTDINDYKTDYLYLLNSKNTKKKIKKDSIRN